MSSIKHWLNLRRLILMPKTSHMFLWVQMFSFLWLLKGVMYAFFIFYPPNQSWGSFLDHYVGGTKNEATRLLLWLFCWWYNPLHNLLWRGLSYITGVTLGIRRVFDFGHEQSSDLSFHIFIFILCSTLSRAVVQVVQQVLLSAQGIPMN